MNPNDIKDWHSFLKDNGCDNIADYGEWIMCNCLFHNQTDKSRPGMGIYKESGIINCFGCGSHKWEDLCEVFGLSSFDFIDAVRASTWESFKNKITKQKKEKKYKRYKLPNQLQNPMGKKYSRLYIEKRNFDYNILQMLNIKLCIDPESKYSDHLIFPIEDEKGVLFFDARYVGDNENTIRWRKPKDSAVWKTYFNWQNVCSEKVLVFVEGAADAVKLIQYGFHAVAAKTFSPYQISMILNSKSKHIILAYDQDEGGRYLENKKGLNISFTAKAKVLFKNSGRYIHIMNFPEGCKDPGDIKYRSDLINCNKHLLKFF